MPLCELVDRPVGLRWIVPPPPEEFDEFDFHVDDWFVGRLFTFRLPADGVTTRGVLIGWTATGWVRTVRGLDGLVRTVL